MKNAALVCVRVQGHFLNSDQDVLKLKWAVKFKRGNHLLWMTTRCA